MRSICILRRTPLTLTVTALGEPDRGCTWQDLATRIPVCLTLQSTRQADGTGVPGAHAAGETAALRHTCERSRSGSAQASPAWMPLAPADAARDLKPWKRHRRNDGSTRQVQACRDACLHCQPRYPGRLRKEIQSMPASTMACANARGASCGKLWPIPPATCRCSYLPENFPA